MVNPRAILFDLDGTLLDNSEIVIEAYYTGMQKLGYEPKNKEFIRSILGKSTFATGRELGLKEKDLSKIDAYFWTYFGQFAKDSHYFPKIYPGVQELLEFLKLHCIPTAIVTSNKSEFAFLLMQKIGLDKYITEYIGSEDVDEKKPSPEPIFTTLKMLNIVKNNLKDETIWYVGDTSTDIETAINAGVASISIPEKEKIKFLKEKHPDFIFESIIEFNKYIN